MRRSLTRHLVPMIVAVALLHSRDCPAPPPPISNCSSGIPVRLALQYTTPVAGTINSQVTGLFVQAFDAAGQPLRNVPIALTAPASGPSGTFNVFTGSYTYLPTPNPRQTTQSTDDNCNGAAPLFIANGTVGDFQLAASAAGAPSLAIPVSNVALQPPARIYVTSAPQAAHTSQNFEPLTVFLEGPAGQRAAGIPVVFNLPTSGPGATFPGGATGATANTDAFGRAVSPVFTANDEIGPFAVRASTPGLPSIKAAQLVNGRGTTTRIAFGATAPASTVYGQPLHFVASVAFHGFPSTGSYYGPPGFANPGGNVILKVDGQQFDSRNIDNLLYQYGACAACPELTLQISFTSASLAFGMHQLTAEYVPGPAYDPSSSDPLPHTVVPALIGTTATGSGQIRAGVSSANWVCTLASGESVPVELVPRAPPPGYLFPDGLFRYRIDQCRGPGTFGVPPAGYRANQRLVLELPVAPPPRTVFMNFGPTRDETAPHWYEVPATVNGNVIDVALSDGDPGDDDLVINNVIVGLGGPAILANYQGMWVVPNLTEAGWGINVTHQGDIIFVSWFTYDAHGNPWWVTMTAQQQSDGSFVGPIDLTTGPSFSAVPFDPAHVTHATVGTGRLTFSDTDNGTFSYTVNGIAQTKALARFLFAAQGPVCRFNDALAATQAVNYQDMWVVPNLAEAGWGINFTHQGDIIFASWFSYDLDGNPFWVTATLTKTAARTYTGPLDATTGPPFNSVPFDPSDVAHGTVGMGTVTFADGANGTFAYTLNGVSQTKSLTRFVFRAPGTVCQ